MRTLGLCFCLALLLPCGIHAQGGSQKAEVADFDEAIRRGALAVDIINRGGVLNTLLRSEHRVLLRPVRAPQVPKRTQPGSRFALSLDVPTSILSVLIDLAKNQDMRTKAAANAELMARVGKKK
ncbi:urocortin-3-like [Syngnathus acus]|uniref:urocortin-3-like n=1 Tax=Syngnathus acus TaxID=161584 RepID=UPI0018860E70|nr:urocortin-3-like [Syngnathus acus]